jgi:Sigma-70 region 2
MASLLVLLVPACGHIIWTMVFRGLALLRLATTLTGGDRGRAEDLVQETMLRAWTRRNNLDMHEGIGSTRRRAAVTMAAGHGAEVTVSGQPLPGPLAHLAPVLQEVSAGQMHSDAAPGSRSIPSR